MRRPACSIMRRPAVAGPTAARTGAEWLPDRARQAQSHLRGANASRAVAVRRSRPPSAVRRPPSAVRRPPSLVLRDALAQCGRAPPSAGRAGAGPARARATSACKQTAVPPARSKVAGSFTYPRASWAVSREHLEHLECDYQPHMGGRENFFFFTWTPKDIHLESLETWTMHRSDSAHS